MEKEELEKIKETLTKSQIQKQNLQNSVNALIPFLSSSHPPLHWPSLHSKITSIESSIHSQILTNPQKVLTFLAASESSAAIAALLPSLRRLLNIRHVADLLSTSLPSSPNPARLVLDVMHQLESFELRSCTVLLKAMEDVGPEVGPGEREEAREMVRRWHTRGKDGAFATLFAYTVFGIDARGDFEEVVLPAFVVAAEMKWTFQFVNKLGIRDKLPMIVQKLSEHTKNYAVKFICTFKLEGKYPPVPLLKGFIEDTENSTEQLLRKRNYSQDSQKEAINIQVRCLREVIMLVKEYKLDAEYPIKDLKRRISELKNQKSEEIATSSSPWMQMEAHEKNQGASA